MPRENSSEVSKQYYQPVFRFLRHANVETAGAKRRCVVRRQRFRFWNELGPQVWLRHQNTSLQILLNLCPRSLCFIGRQPLLKHGQAQRVSEFNAVKAGEINREWIRLSPRIGSG